MGPLPRFLSLVFALSLGALAAGCKQGPGERCEVNRDCEGGYFCDPSAGDNSGGICKPYPTSESSDASSTDAAGETAADAAEDAETATEDAALSRDADGSTDAATDIALAETASVDSAGE